MGPCEEQTDRLRRTGTTCNAARRTAACNKSGAERKQASNYTSM